MERCVLLKGVTVTGAPVKPGIDAVTQVRQAATRNIETDDKPIISLQLDENTNH